MSLPPPPQGPWTMEWWHHGGGLQTEDRLVTNYRIDGDVFMVRFEDGALLFTHLTQTAVELTPTS